MAGHGRGSAVRGQACSGAEGLLPCGEGCGQRREGPGYGVQSLQTGDGQVQLVWPLLPLKQAPWTGLWCLAVAHTLPQPIPAAPPRRAPDASTCERRLAPEDLCLQPRHRAQGLWWGRWRGLDLPSLLRNASGAMGFGLGHSGFCFPRGPRLQGWKGSLEGQDPVVARS